MRARRRGAGERFASAALSGLDSVSRRRHDGVPEHVVFEKGGTRGGSAASPGLKRAEKRVFCETTGRMVWNARPFKLKLLYLTSRRLYHDGTGQARGVHAAGH